MVHTVKHYSFHKEILFSLLVVKLQGWKAGTRGRKEYAQMEQPGTSLCSVIMSLARLAPFQMIYKET